ncbi:MAG: peptidoglycan DD-metalloendopeptidase family protein [Pseudomonadota bacterium]|nr:peptidoglycan DD-metalloendopeptidase family protein [Pseudomonadota bacterium]
MAQAPDPANSESSPAATLPRHAAQGTLVTGQAAPGSTVTVDGRAIRVAEDGRFVFALGRDATGTQTVRVHAPGRSPRDQRLQIIAQAWPTQHINGLPPATVNPPPAIAERIRREQASVAAVRQRDDPRLDWQPPFIRPVEGRTSGRFGRQRVYNGQPGAAHSGMDIAAATGTPIKAPAAGIITFANADLYLTGGTVVLDHGFGISSNFLHLSRIDVKPGDHVRQGQVIGAVGSTGRSTGPHLHWGMNWFEIRIDPQTMLERP